MVFLVLYISSLQILPIRGDLTHNIDYNMDSTVDINCLMSCSILISNIYKNHLSFIILNIAYFYKKIAVCVNIKYNKYISEFAWVGNKF